MAFEKTLDKVTYLGVVGRGSDVLFGIGLIPQWTGWAAAAMEEIEYLRRGPLSWTIDMRRAIAFLFSFPLVAQQTGDYSMSGIVSNAETGEPVKYALVTLMSVPKFEPENRPANQVVPRQMHTQTDGAGQFQFHGLAKGSYTLGAQKPGFNPAFKPSGQLQLDGQIQVDGSVSGVQIQLSPLGVIEGKVVDQNDEPLRGVNIIALQVTINDGDRETNRSRAVTTDDRGMFRLWNLAPGKYYLKAAGKSGGTQHYVGDGMPYYSSWESFTPVYFGGGGTLESATAIEIGPGSKGAVDFHLNFEPAFRVRGTLDGAPSGTVTFELLQSAEDVSASRTSLNSTTGRFEIQDVTPGTYTLRVTQEGKMRGEARVTVKDGDVNGISISLAPAATVRAVTRVIGAPLMMKQMPGFDRMLAEAQKQVEATRAAGANTGDVDLKQLMDEANQAIEPNCIVALHGQGRNPMSGVVPRPRNGQTPDEHVIGDFLPGDYRVRVQCTNGYPISVLAGGVDLLANPTLTIAPGSPVPTIEVQVKPGGGTLHGELAVKPAPESAGILLVPASGRASGPVMVPLIGDPASDFERPFLAPGDYTAYGFSNWQQIEFRNPAFLETLSGGISVHIEDGKEQQVTITRLVK
jgi:hypothetical protein